MKTILRRSWFTGIAIFLISMLFAGPAFALMTINSVMINTNPIFDDNTISVDVNTSYDTAWGHTGFYVGATQVSCQALPAIANPGISTQNFSVDLTPVGPGNTPLEVRAYQNDATCGAVTADDDDEMAALVILPVADTSITKTDGLTEATAGATTITYTIVASNAGPSDASGLSIMDTFPLTCSWTSVAAGGATGNTNGAGNLNDTVAMPAGSSITYTAGCGVLPADQTGTLSNTATIDEGPNDPDSNNNSATDDTAVGQVIDIVITQEQSDNDGDPDDPDNGTVTAGDCNNCALHKFTVTNNGPSTATGVMLSREYLPGSLQSDVTSNETETDGVYTQGDGSWLIATLAPGTPEMLTLVYSVGASAPASVGADDTTKIRSRLQFVSANENCPGDVACSDNSEILSTEIDRESAISISKTAETQVALGTDLVYTITITNDGPSDADDLIVKDTLPDGLTLSSSSVACTQLLQEVTCEDIDVPAVPGEVEITLTVPIPEDYLTGTISNVATVDTSASSSTDTTPDDNVSPQVDTRVVVAVAAEGTALIAVQKLFLDGNDETEVTLTLQCASGTYAPESVSVIPDNELGLLGDNIEHIFVIDSIPEGVPNPCTVVEEPIDGYGAAHFCLPEWSSGETDGDLCLNGLGDIEGEGDIFDLGTEACGWTDVRSGDSDLCVIVNYPLPVDVDVTKVWEMFGAAQADINTDVRITLFCDAEIVGGVKETNKIWKKNKKITDYLDADGVYDGIGVASFKVIPDWYRTANNPENQRYTECWATENIKNDAVEITSDCGDGNAPGMQLAVGMGDECTITNTVFFEGIPTLNQYGMALLALLMLGMGFIGIRRFV